MGEEFRKQQKKDRGVSKTSFDELADDLKIDVFRRLGIKDRGKLKRVSKEWRILMAAAAFPMYYGLLYKYEHVNKPLGEVFCISYGERALYHHKFSLDSIGLSFKLTRELQESCNGLLLLCHTYNEFKRVQVSGVANSRRYYTYYVVNPLTGQYVEIAKPKQNSGSYKYAALAYHPAESSHFKIVRFRVTHLDVYSSETGKWSSSRVQLSENVLRANWMKQSVYFEGSIYRLSMSGHVLRFVDDNKNATKKSWVVQEIDIPGTTEIVNEAACIGLSNGQIKFAICDGLSLKIWELNNKLIDSCDNQQGRWSLKFSCPWNEISKSSYISPARLLTFHPHLNAIIFGCVDHKDTRFRCIHYGEKMTKSCHLTFPIHSRWGKNHKSVFPLFRCEAPFANDIAK